MNSSFNTVGSNFKPDVLGYVSFEEIVPNFEGHRIRFVYDSPLVKDLIVLQHLVPHFVERLPIYIVLYSEAFYYKFVKRVSCAINAMPELKEKIEELRVIKVGRKKFTKYGKLAYFIEQNDFETEFDLLLSFLSGIEEDSVLILFGSVGYYLMGLGNSALRKLIDLFSSIPESATVFGFRHKSYGQMDMLIDLYDVIVSVWRDEQSFDHNAFCFTVECQCRGGVKHGKLKIENGRLVSII